MVSKEILAKFKSLYKTKFDIQLSDEEATKMANDLVNLMQILLEPKSNNNTSTIEERTLHEAKSI